MKLSELRKRSNQFVKNLPKIIGDVIDYNEDLEQLNKDQLEAGKLSNDQSIRPSYNPGYAIWKKNNYPQSFAGHVNLKLDGNLYNNLEIRVRGNDYELFSNVPYAARLSDKYSDKIFGIAPSNQNKAKAITTKLIAEQYKRLVL